MKISIARARRRRRRRRRRRVRTRIIVMNALGMLIGRVCHCYK